MTPPITKTLKPGAHLQLFILHLQKVRGFLRTSFAPERTTGNISEVFILESKGYKYMPVVWQLALPNKQPSPNGIQEHSSCVSQVDREG
jgi:hypothetical protein